MVSSTNPLDVLENFLLRKKTNGKLIGRDVLVTKVSLTSLVGLAKAAVLGNEKANVWLVDHKRIESFPFICNQPT